MLDLPGKSDALLTRSCPPGPTTQKRTAFRRQIEAAERQMESLVYELYALTEEEIGIVDGRMRR